MRSRLTRTAAGALALGIATLTLVGCGDDAKSSGTQTTGAATETTVAAASSGATDTTAAPTEGTATESASSTGGSASRESILYTAVGAGSFLTLAKLLGTAGLLDTVKDGGPYTVFAPTDAAFAKVPADTLAALAADKDKLTKVLLYHVVPGALTKAQLAAGEVKTAEGSMLKITNDAAAFQAGAANVVAADVLASNGVIHVVDSVILPPDL